MEKNNKQPSLLSSIVKVGSVLLGIGAILYVGNELKKEYDSTVEENSRLKDFIKQHDFYKKEYRDPIVAMKAESKTRFRIVPEHEMFNFEEAYNSVQEPPPPPNFKEGTL